MSPRRLVRLAASVGAAAGYHLALTADAPGLALALLSIPFLVHAILLLTEGVSPGRLGTPLTGAVLFITLAAAAHLGPPDLRRLVILPAVLINAMLAITFGRTLVGGRVPLISHFASLNRGGTLPPQLVAYTRRLTVVWTLYFTVLTVLAIAFSGGDPGLWSWAINIGGPLGACLLFLGDHGVRAILYPDLGHHSPLRTIALLARPDTWTRP